MKLIKNDLYLLLIDEEVEIKFNDLMYDSKLEIVIRYNSYNDGCSKIIAYYPLKEAKELDLPLLPKHDIEGFRVIQNKQFSLEDIDRAFEEGWKSKANMVGNRVKDKEAFIQSLSTQQLPKEFEPLIEIYDFDHGVGRSCIPRKILKTTTNSEGKEEIQGRYVY